MLLEGTAIELYLPVAFRSSLTDCGVMTDGDMGSSHAYSLCPDCGSAVRPDLFSRRLPSFLADVLQVLIRLVNLQVNCTCTNTSFGVVSETDADMILHLGDFAYNFDTAVDGQSVRKHPPGSCL